MDTIGLEFHHNPFNFFDVDFLAGRRRRNFFSVHEIERKQQWGNGSGSELRTRVLFHHNACSCTLGFAIIDFECVGNIHSSYECHD